MSNPRQTIAAALPSAEGRHLPEPRRHGGGAVTGFEETEWRVWCSNGHRFYLRVQMTASMVFDGFEFSDCPTCGAPRTGAPVEAR